MKLFKKKERRKEGREPKMEGFLGSCFKMLSPCFALAEKLQLKVSPVPYGYFLSVSVLAASEQTAWNGFDSVSSPLLPVCCFTLDQWGVPASLSWEWDQAEAPQQMLLESEAPIIGIICSVPAEDQCQQSIGMSGTQSLCTGVNRFLRKEATSCKFLAISL